MRIAFILALVSSTALARPTQVDSIEKLEGPRAGRVIGPPNENGLLVIDTSYTRKVLETHVKLKTTVDDAGQQVQRKVAHVVHIPVSDNHVTVVLKSNVRFELNGIEIVDSDELNKHLVSGTPVLVSPLKLDAKRRDVLNERTIVIWPKEQAKQPRPEVNHLTPLKSFGEPERRKVYGTDEQDRIPKRGPLIVE